MTPLRVCEACSRHVLVTEQSCPFCKSALGPAPQRSFGKQLRAGMSRAQILAVAAAVTGQTLGACSDTVTRDGDGDGNAGESGEGGGSGEAGTGTGGRSGAGGTSVSGGGTSGMVGGAAGVAGMFGGSGGDIAVPEYGGSFPLDSGLDEDGGVDEEPMAIPIYSAPNPRE